MPRECSIVAGQQEVTYRLGPFSISTGERLLRREADVLSMPPKVIETLLLLLERQGELITKEDLRQRVWDGAFVEENSITQNISRLRRLLEPEFPGEKAILTVPKRGYRLVLPVEVESCAPRVSHIPTALAPVAEPPHLPPVVEEPAVAVVSRWISIAVPLCLVLGMVLACAGWYLWRTHRRAAAHTRPSVAILGFDNLAQRPENDWLSAALTDMMYTELAANQKLLVIPNGTVAEMRQGMALPRTISLSPDSLQEVRKTLGCDMVVIGHYLVSNGNLRLDIVLQDARTGETLDTFTHTDPADHLLPLVASAGEDLRHRLGEQTLTPVQTGEVQASVAVNPDALRAYAEGMTRLQAMDAVGAQAYLEEAIRLEPGYPMAHAALSKTWSLLGYDDKARREAKMAIEHSGSLSREERLEVGGRSYEASTQWDKAATTYQALWLFYPDNSAYGLSLANALTADGKAQQALQVIAELKGGGAQNVDAMISLAEAKAYSALTNFTLSATAADTAIAQARSRRNLVVLERSLLVRGIDANKLGAQEQARSAYAEARSIASGLGDSATVVQAMSLDADLLRQQGNTDAAKIENNEAIALATKMGDRHNLIRLYLNMTQVYRPEGNLTMQKQYAERALTLAAETSDRQAQAMALLDLGNALNNIGDPDRAVEAYQQCMQLAREIGDKALFSRAAGNLGIIEYTHGHLASAQSLLEQGLAISRATGEKSSVAYKLGHYATVLMYENRLPEARAALKEQCDLQSSLGEKGALVVCQIATAQLAVAEDHPQEAIGPLLQITAAAKTVNPAFKAWEALAEAQLATGNVPAAGDAVAHAREVGKGTVNPAEFAIPVALLGGRVLGASGNDADALKLLEQARDGADKLKLLPVSLQARLAIASVTMRTQPAKARQEVKSLETEAGQAGFLGIAAAAKRLGAGAAEPARTHAVERGRRT